MDKNIFNVAGHTVEVRYSPTGSCDPWTLEYAREKGVSLMCTSDMANFLLVDGDKLYRLKGGAITIFGHYLEKNVIDPPEAFDLWLDEIKEQEFGTLSESKKQIDEMKEKQDAWKRLSPEEKERQIAEWRARRAEHLKK